MALNTSKPVGQDYRGIGVLHPQFVAANLDTTNSSFTQAGPRPGMAVADQKTDAVLDTSGYMPTVTGFTRQITIETAKGGMPGNQGARFLFQDNTRADGSSLTKMGWDGSTSIAYSRIVIRNPAKNYVVGGCITLQSNVVLLSVCDSGATNEMYRKTFGLGFLATGNPLWSWVGPPATTPNPTGVVPDCACFIQLPEGRVHHFVLYKDSTLAGAEFYQVYMYYSDDDGASWSNASKPMLSTEIDASGTPGVGAAGFDAVRMRAAYANGEVLLMIHVLQHNTTPTYRDGFMQYASSDLGTGRFSQIDLGGTGGGYFNATGDTDIGGYHDVVALLDGSGFFVPYLQGGPVCGLLGKVLPSAFTNWTEITAADVGTPGLSRGASPLDGGANCTAAVDANGNVWVSVTNDAGGAFQGNSNCYVSYDNAVTWTRVDGRYSTAATESTWWRSGDPLLYPTLYSSTFQCGRWMIFTVPRVSDLGGDPVAISTETAVWEIELGGHTALTLPFKTTVETEYSQIAWEINWIAWQRFADTTGWTAVGTGAEAIVDDHSTVTCGGADTYNATNATVTATAGGLLYIIGSVEMKVTTGTANWRVLIGDGATIIEMYLQVTTTTLNVFDVSAGAVLDTVALPAPADWNQYLWSVNFDSGGTCRVHVAVRDSTGDTESRKWILVSSNKAISTLASVATSLVGLRQGNTSTASYREAHWTSGLYGRPPTLSASALFGRSFSPYPIPVCSGDGLRLRAVDGPSWGATSGDSWTIAQFFQHGIDRIFPGTAPSPADTWRSAGLTQQDIVVTLGMDGDPEPLLSQVLMVAALNVNFPQLQISYRTSSGAGWTALGNLDFNSGMVNIRWARDGKMITPTTTGDPVGDYFTHNILAGSHIVIYDSHPGVGDVARRIESNSEGYWTGATTIRPRLRCPDITGAEDGSGNNGEIWMKDGILFIHDMPDIYQLKFTIPAGICAEAYWQIGTLFVGHVAYFGRQYARGRALSFRPNYNLTTTQSGRRSARSLGTMRRGVEFSWANGNETDTKRLSLSTPDPDYILPATGGTPVAGPGDTAWKLAGLVDLNLGAVQPVFYLAKIPMVAATTTDTTLVNRNTFFYGRIVSPIRIDSVMGDEWGTAGELVRIATVEIEEEL